MNHTIRNRNFIKFQIWGYNKQVTRLFPNYTYTYIHHPQQSFTEFVYYWECRDSLVSFLKSCKINPLVMTNIAIENDHS